MTQDQQAQQVAGMMAGMGVVFVLVAFVMVAFFVFLLWRIFTKAGMAGPLALLVIIPAVGPLIALCILAFGQWKVVPAQQAYGGYPPQFPPQNFPPANYPPQGPPQY